MGRRAHLIVAVDVPPCGLARRSNSSCCCWPRHGLVLVVVLEFLLALVVVVVVVVFVIVVFVFVVVVVVVLAVLRLVLLAVIVEVCRLPRLLVGAEHACGRHAPRVALLGHEQATHVVS